MSAVMIAGTWIEGSGTEFASHDPATGATLWRHKAAAGAEVERAFTAARAAFGPWSRMAFAEREAIVRRFAELLGAQREHLASVISRETGKPRWETLTEVSAMINKVDLSVKAYWQRTGVTQTEAAGVRSVIRHRPHGVVAVFGPYNFPGHLPNGHIVPALLAGNCVLFKPSEITPWTAEETVKLWLAAGLPSGVLALLPGERATGEAIAAHPDLDGLYFTGSSRTGHLLHRQFAETPHKILALEMGGNNPLVIGALGEDLRPAIHDTLQSAFLSSGQRCTCARRLFVPEGARGDQFIAALVEATAAIRVGNWDDEPQPFMGPLVTAQAARGMMLAQQQLMDLGAHALLPMRQRDADSAFLTPGILDVSPIAAQLPDEEHFGPLLKVIRYQSFEQALSGANATRYGLSAGLLSNDGAQWEQFLATIRAGIVNWNRQTTGASSAAPFGGVGDSGNHRASALYAADYCAYPVASMEADACTLPASLAPGLHLPS